MSYNGTLNKADNMRVLLTVEVTRAKNRAKCTCLYCNNFQSAGLNQRIFMPKKNHKNNSSQRICFISQLIHKSTLILSKWRSIFFHGTIIWQQDEMFVYFLVQFQISPWLFVYRYYNFIIIKQHSFSVKMMHHLYFYDQY